MNCIDKMYKEIEEIIKKEQAELEHLKVPIKEIKHGFSFNDEVDEVEDTIVVDYLSQITFDSNLAQKKYFSYEKAVKFIEFIFKKYAVTVSKKLGEDKFCESIPKKIKDKEGSDLVEVLNGLENEFVNLFLETDEVKEFFLNPYNALFKDETGYYAVILNGRFSDIKRPQSFLLNQVKKLVKESLDEYILDFSSHFNSEKERVAVLNSIKAEVNKCTKTKIEEIEEVLENALYNHLAKKGVKRAFFDKYIEEKGLKLIKQGNNLYRKKAYENYAEYKKIEFRY